MSALDLFTQQDASNLAVSFSLDIKRKLFGKSCDDVQNATHFCYLVMMRGFFLGDLMEKDCGDYVNTITQ